MTTTDDDLRDLLWRMGNSPGEIEAHMANPYAKVCAKVFLDELNRRFAELLARRIVEKLFPEIKGARAHGPSAD
jgi:hypothetical protein